MRKSIIAVAVVAVAAAVMVAVKGLPLRGEASGAAKPAAGNTVPDPTVTVVRARAADLREVLKVNGTLVAREEILVGPEVEGLRVLEVLADEGDRVTQGQVLARLVSETLDAQLAQNDAALARATFAIAQASSRIVLAEAKLVEARNAFARGQPLRKQGWIADAALEQREAAAKSADADVASAREGLKLAEAEKAQVEAQRREIVWRRARTDVTAPADGIVSRRNARIGAYASGAAEPMFRIIAKSEVELDAEVIETRIASLRAGQKARIEVAGAGEIAGVVRLVSPEVDKATRLGRVRVFIGDNPAARVGSFARAAIETAESRAVAVPASAVLYGADSASVQIVRNNRVTHRQIKTGLRVDDLVEVREGVADGELVVAKAGTFLRDGDAVTPVAAAGTKLSEAN